MGIYYGNPAILTTLYSMIHAEYWSGWRKTQNKYWMKKFKKGYDDSILNKELQLAFEKQNEAIKLSEKLNYKFLPIRETEEIILSKNAK